MDLDAAINETKIVLQPLFSKPKLSSKLLSKPPFRFIHDIVTATIEATGFPCDLFEPHELQSSSYKDDKPAKLKFLDKLILLVNMGRECVLEVQSSKIVAGLEPLNSNILLTSFGLLAVDLNINKSALIQRCRDGLGIKEFKHKQSVQRDISAAATNTIDPKLDIKEEYWLYDGLGSKPVDRNEHSFKEKFDKCNEDIDQTIEMISKIVPMPECTEKVLSRPSFRFLYDVFMTIANATKFDLDQVLSNEDINSAKIIDKQDKIKFLQKLIAFLEIKTNTAIDVEPSKIVSGLETGKTLYLLQVYSVVATSNVTSLLKHPICEAPIDIHEGIKPDDEEKALQVHLKPDAIECPSTAFTSINVNNVSPPATANSTEAFEDVKQAFLPHSPKHSQEQKIDNKLMNDDVDEKLPDFEEWLEKIGETKEMNETLITSDKRLRLHRTVSNRPADSFKPPTNLSATDLQSIAAEVEGITELTGSLGRLMGMVSTGIEAMNQRAMYQS